MALLDIVTNLFKPAADLIDNVHTSDEERRELKNQFALIMDGVLKKVYEYENKLLELKASIIKAEMESGLWITKAWRPITMLVFVVLIILDSINWLPKPLNPDAWMLLKIGLGGYVGGRSLEKIVPAVTKIMKGK
jgi:hypothetical protein